MNTIFKTFYLMLLICGVLLGCKKEESTNIVSVPSASTLGFKSSSPSVVLTAATDASQVITFSFKGANFGATVIPNYSLEFDLPSDTSGAKAWGML